MFGNPHSFRWLSSRAKAALGGYKLLLMLLLVLTILSTSPKRPVEAAPETAETVSTPTIEIEELPDPICANTTNRVWVTAHVLRAATLGAQQVNLQGGLGPANAIVSATSSDPNVATLDPQERTISARPAAGQIGAVGTAFFNLHAIEAGETSIFFSTLFPHMGEGGGDIAYLGPALDIQVKDCDYRVTISYSMQQSSQGTFGMISGYLDMLLKRSEERYGGSGTLYGFRTEEMSPCTFLSPGFTSTVKIVGRQRGSQDGGQLELTIDYGTATTTTSITCPFVGTTTKTATESPGNWLTTIATPPAMGGTQTFPIDYAQWHGTMMITVKQLDGDAQ